MTRFPFFRKWCLVDIPRPTPLLIPCLSAYANRVKEGDEYYEICLHLTSFAVMVIKSAC